ncbi:hypothetical protein [Pseudoalteromonas sp. S16_S37]|uniref:hypothetical protein n=1 Tax=Pseudoalteromonas sp. S16_S37 TaxID=2720228 RepID=UPI0016818E3C|nr:hypothetical protein [Pseudoalteromonas sp. S16_S37]MBD1584123.1 hypothetical protein [Pseudoalteromonas sp. S16_S37]
MKRSIVLILIVVSFTWGAAKADGQDVSEKQKFARIASDYIATLDNDYVKQRAFYTQNSHFKDPTSAQFGAMWDIKGGDNIANFFENAGKDYGVLKVDYKITNMLVEPPFVIANIDSEVTTCAVALNQPTKSYTGTIQLVMVLKINGSHVLERTDYVDYSSAWQFVEELSPRLKEQKPDIRCLTNKT